MKVGDALGGIHHRDVGPAIVRGLNVGFDLRALRFRQRLDRLEQVAEAVVHVDAKLVEDARRAWRKRP